MHQNYETLGPVADDVILINNITLARGDHFREKLSNGMAGSTIYEVVSIINSSKTGALIGGRPLFFQNSMATSYFTSNTVFYPLSLIDRGNIEAYKKDLEDLRKKRAEELEARKKQDESEKEQEKVVSIFQMEIDAMNSDYTPPPVRQENFAIMRVPVLEHPNSKFFAREFFILP